MKVLIAEDDRASCLLLKSLLLRWEHDVVVTHDGLEAWEVLSQDNAPKLAILDWMMPGIDGVEVCRRVRALPTSLPVYLILLTTRDSKTDVVEGLETGFDDYITKPFDRSELRARVQAGERIVRLQSDLKAYSETLEQKVQERTRDLELANRVKSDFLSGMNHELRTPLNAIIGFAELLSTQYHGPLNDNQGEYVKYILDNGEHLLSLVEDILDMTPTEAGEEQLKLSDFSIQEVLENSKLTINEAASKNDLQIDMDIEPRIPNMVGDRLKIKQILFNLLSNAVKFTPTGGKVRLAACIVDADSPQETGSPLEKWLQISVEDTGIGIAEEDHKRVFDAFYQVKGGLTGKTSGTGLGLSLAKQFVEIHGGRIWVESEGQGKGSRFCVMLPLRSGLE